MRQQHTMRQITHNKPYHVWKWWSNDELSKFFLCLHTLYHTFFTSRGCYAIIKCDWWNVKALQCFCLELNHHCVHGPSHMPCFWYRCRYICILHVCSRFAHCRTPLYIQVIHLRYISLILNIKHHLFCPLTYLITIPWDSTLVFSLFACCSWDTTSWDAVQMTLVRRLAVVPMHTCCLYLVLVWLLILTCVHAYLPPVCNPKCANGGFCESDDVCLCAVG